nr:unnamed protein product [Digitaria exilis]
MSTGYRIHGRCGTRSAGTSSSPFVAMATIRDPTRLRKLRRGALVTSGGARAGQGPPSLHRSCDLQGGVAAN